MKAASIAERLRKMGACGEAVDWADTLKHRSMQRAWDECPRADWLIWFAAKKGVKREKLVLAACACARTALKFVPKGELRPLKAIETAEAWCRGDATMEEVRAARSAAYAAAAADAAYAADADAYAAAADAAAAAAAAADAAYAADADAAAYAAAADAAAADAAYAADADAAAYAAAADAAAAARSKAHLRMCKLVRKTFPEVPR